MGNCALRPALHSGRNANQPLSRFRVFGMFAAARTELVQTQPFLHVLLVFAGLIIALFALITR
jgi:hypothetical protein